MEKDLAAEDLYIESNLKYVVILYKKIILKQTECVYFADCFFLQLKLLL